MYRWLVICVSFFVISGCITSGEDDAPQYYTRNVKTSAENLPSCLLGWEHTEAGSHLKAIELFEECLSRAYFTPPILARTYRNLGIAQRRASEFRDAVKSFTKAIDLNPDDVWDDYVNRGNAYSGLKQYEEALKNYAKALELKPAYHHAMYNRGIVYERLEKREKASHDFKQAYRFGLRSPQLMERLQYYRRLNSLEQTIAYDEDDPTLKQFSDSCLAGNNKACFTLGHRFEKGEGVNKDLKKAANLYLRACELGGVQACFRALDLKALLTKLKTE